MKSAVGELEPRAQHEIPHGAGGEHLPRRRHRADARTDVAATPEIESPSTLTSPVWSPEWTCSRGSCTPPVSPEYTDGSGRADEGGEEPVAGRVDLAAPKPGEESTYRSSVLLAQISPAAVAELLSEGGRA